MWLRQKRIGKMYHTKCRHALLWVFLLLASPMALVAQLDVNFDNGDLSIWSGDVSNFIVNGDGELQLNAAEGGSSMVQTAITLSDSIFWSMELELDFAPSTSNFLDYWLLVDDPSSDMPSGFLLRFGESGSDDAIQFLEVIDGSEIMIASGDMGQIASGFDLRVQMQKDAGDEWVLTTQDLGAEPLPAESFRVVHATSDLTGSHMLGWLCDYTSTRTDRFFFDNIVVRDLLPDTEAPSLVFASIINSRKILVQFSEAMDEASARNTANYKLSVGGREIAVESIVASAGRSDILCLEIADFPSGQVGRLTIAGITDVVGNSLAQTTVELTLAVTPELGDIVLNEILYDPLPGRDADFVEIINVSDKFLSLDSVFFARANSTATDVKIETGTRMDPNQILAFTDDQEEIRDIYLPPSEANIIELNITNYVNDEGNVSVYSILDGQRILLDSFDYTDDFHSPILTSDSREGISLERISTVSETNDGNNWFSASTSVNNGTPGYENSQRSSPITGDEMVALENKVFSPDADGFQDLAVLQYSLDKNGFIGNVTVFDDHGRRETQIAQNQLLGTEGNFIWEGALDDGTPAPIGMYILQYELFHPDGDIVRGKEVVVLARRL